MPYTVPTVEQFTTRFPEFASNDEEQIALLLQDSAFLIDCTWREVDYQPAIMYMTAHHLTNANAAADYGGGSMPGSVSAETFGPISVSYGGQSGNSSGSGGAWSGSPYSTTDYGRRYLRLRDGNFPAIMVV